MIVSRAICAFAAGLFLGGCAALEPYDPISDAEFKGPLLRVVRAVPVSYLDYQIRWGGEIAGTDHHSDETWVEIIERPLDRSGQPRIVERSGGRFIARIGSMLDPEIYVTGRRITVVGPLKPAIRRKLGAYLYEYPVVDARFHRLW